LFVERFLLCFLLSKSISNNFSRLFFLWCHTFSKIISFLSSDISILHSTIHISVLKSIWHGIRILFGTIVTILIKSFQPYTLLNFLRQILTLLIIFHFLEILLLHFVKWFWTLIGIKSCRVKKRVVIHFIIRRGRSFLT